MKEFLSVDMFDIEEVELQHALTEKGMVMDHQLPMGRERLRSMDDQLPMAPVGRERSGSMDDQESEFAVS